eukprot:5418781-Alexandrium_andersonii.AAC.1
MARATSPPPSLPTSCFKQSSTSQLATVEAGKGPSRTCSSVGGGSEGFPSATNTSADTAKRRSTMVSFVPWPFTP